MSSVLNDINSDQNIIIKLALMSQAEECHTKASYSIKRDDSFPELLFVCLAEIIRCFSTCNISRHVCMCENMLKILFNLIFASIGIGPYLIYASFLQTITNICL